MTSKMIFITVTAFKTRIGTTELPIVKSPKTGKLFASGPVNNYKVEGTIDLGLPIKYMYESEQAFDEGCLVNVTSSTDNELGRI